MLAVEDLRKGRSGNTSNGALRRNCRSRAVTRAVPPIATKRVVTSHTRTVKWESSVLYHHDKGGSNKQLRAKVEERKRFRRESTTAVEDFQRREKEQEYLRASTQLGRATERFRGSAMGDLLSLANRNHPEIAQDVVLFDEEEKRDCADVVDDDTGSGSTAGTSLPDTDQTWNLMSMLSLGFVDSGTSVKDSSSPSHPAVVVDAEKVVTEVHYDGDGSNSDFSEGDESVGFP